MIFKKKKVSGSKEEPKQIHKHSVFEYPTFKLKGTIHCQFRKKLMKRAHLFTQNVPLSHNKIHRWIKYNSLEWK